MEIYWQCWVLENNVFIRNLKLLFIEVYLFALTSHANPKNSLDLYYLTDDEIEV